MKVLSITEPYATLIRNNVKTIETRSWKTNYRGELYIHASSTRIPKAWRENENLMSLVKSDLNFGKIICKCNLIDCVEMTQRYVYQIKNWYPVEYACGFYEVGRYAWILDDVEPIEPIKVKGKLGIWEMEI